MKRNKTIVQDNELLEGAYFLNVDELRLLNLALSKIDSPNPQPPTPYIITALEFRDTYSLTSKAHKKLKDAAQSLMTKPIRLYKRCEKRKGVTIGTEYPWFSLLQYDSTGDSSVKVVFSEFVRPYLYDIAKNFTQVKFYYIAKLDSPFAARLYYWLAKTRNFGTASVELGIQWMKDRTGLTAKYSDYRNFRLRVIEPAITLINRNTDLSVTYQTVKKGKTVTALIFSYIIDKEPSTDVTRPRLPRRPPARTGTHLEGEWVRKCINILLKYEIDLKQKEDKKLPREDAKKLIRYALMTGDKFLADDIRKRYGIDTDKVTTNQAATATANTDGYLASDSNANAHQDNRYLAADGNWYESKIAYYQHLQKQQ